MISTGDAPLNDACIEYKRMGNIDIFNNFWTCFYHPRMWEKIGKPQQITNDVYAQSPFFATLKRMQAKSSK